MRISDWSSDGCSSDLIDPDTMFASTGQQYRTGNFIEGQVLTIANASYVVADGVVIPFPMAQYIKSRVCASIAVLEDDESWPPEFLDWSGEPLAYSRYRGTTPDRKSTRLNSSH